MLSWSRRGASAESLHSAQRFVGPQPALRLATFVILTLFEIVVASSVYDSPRGLSTWLNPILYANWLALAGLLAFVAFPLIAWPRRVQIFQKWKVVAPRQNWATAVVVNMSLFALLLLARAVFAHAEPEATNSYWYWAYTVLLLATGSSLALVAAPLSFWRDLVKTAPLEILLALIAAVVVLVVSELSKQTWDTLSAATLALSHWFLSLYETNPYLDTQRRILGVGDFRVQIWPSCSGYEGIGIIITFLSIYLWVFRRHLRFPNALLLLPAGIILIWVLNSLRIAMLTSIGGHISRDLAVNGGHSWFGWIMFLAVTIGIMTAVPSIKYFWKSNGNRSQTAQDQNERIVLACLTPFAALMAANILASAFAPHDQWLYPIKVLAVGLTLWCFRDVYAGLVASVSPISVLAGFMVGVLWIATDPNPDAETTLGPWLASLPVSLVILWLVFRAFGSVVLVPLAEELAFRGHLYRALAAWRFDAFDAVQFRWFALIVSSLAFGILHERWLAATLAGAVYALIMCRTNKLSDPIVAHLVSNAAVVAWSIAAGQWTLL